MRSIWRVMGGALDSRRGVIMLCAGCMVLLVGLLAILGPSKTWGLWNFNHLTPVFADLRVVTHGAESRAQGFDPMETNPADPWGRVLNYPRVWQYLSPAGLNRTHTTGLALGLIGGFLAAVCFVMPHANRQLLVFTGLALLSPAMMLGVERGNLDLLLFALTAVAIGTAGRSSAVTVGVLIVGFALKLFPVFAFLLLVRSGERRFWRSMWWLVGLSGGYVVLNLSDLARVRSKTPLDTEASFGCHIWWMEMGESGASLALVLVLLTVVATSVALGMGVRMVGQGRGDLDIPESTLALDAFRAGAGIYVGTFLTSNNYDYRLMFLIFTLPQLAVWAGHENVTVRRVTRLTLAMLFVSMWDFNLEYLLGLLGVGGSIHFVVDQLANWGLFLGLSYLLARSLPRWILDRTVKVD